MLQSITIFPVIAAETIDDAFEVENVTTVRIEHDEGIKKSFRFSSTLYPAGWTIRIDRKGKMTGVTKEVANAFLKTTLSSMFENDQGWKAKDCKVHALVRTIEPINNDKEEPIEREVPEIANATFET